MLTFLVGEETGAEDDRVDDVRIVEDARTVEETRIELDDEAGLEELTLPPEHVPNDGLHPVPQWPVDVPHQPYLIDLSTCFQI